MQIFLSSFKKTCACFWHTCDWKFCSESEINIFTIVSLSVPIFTANQRPMFTAIFPYRTWEILHYNWPIRHLCFFMEGSQPWCNNLCITMIKCLGEIKLFLFACAKTARISLVNKDTLLSYTLGFLGEFSEYFIHFSRHTALQTHFFTLLTLAYIYIVCG